MEMSEAARRVAEALAAAGVEAEVRSFAESTRTADEAAAAVGANVGQIVKSLVFLADGRPILALVSGANRLDTAKLAQITEAKITRADADTVRAATGYAIGGVPPVGLATALPVYCDRDLLQQSEVWAAAGTPHTVFSIEPETLARITNAEIVDLAVIED
ncbi:MAG TPA: YbaK/EbsC family protein [Ktedonobacterales bacterium]|jgi:Cys-tRNA(Pro) deacylase|nr:YbaK/EbsC family protein [Ktedonobacterales bacterium]